jgi:hypothetical protein
MFMKTTVIAVSIVTAAASLLPGCTDAGKCRIGTEGCICTETGTCESGLECVGASSGSAGAGEGDPGFCEGTGSGILCEDTCDSATDGSCDDGGEGHDFATCELGTDCSDCGPRETGSTGDPVCSDTCPSAGDGDCDDGGEGAKYDRCDWGTDCSDCGERFGTPPSD